MTRARRLPLILLLPLALTACGTERPATRAALEARTRAMESAVELIYVTELPGYELARQSVGVYGDDGFQSAYVSASDGSSDRKTVNRGTLRRAAESAHRADNQELDAVLPELGPDSAGRPVERGDLPPVGDGAPDNGVGVSG